MEQKVSKIVLWIKEEVIRTGGQGVVLGMSGGIDSSVAAVLCHKAFPESTVGVIMPSHSVGLDEIHAKLVAGRFGIIVIKIALDKVFDVLVEELRSIKLQINQNQSVKGNIKSRLRMTVLYYFANCLNYRVVGASNQSELSLGYFTKYGDSGVDLMPLGNMVKKEVRELAYYLDIPKEIIEKPPSAGLWKGQTDEDELGLTYEEIDSFLRIGGGSDKIKKKINSIITKNSHKMFPPLLPPSG